MMKRPAYRMALGVRGAGALVAGVMAAACGGPGVPPPGIARPVPDACVRAPLSSTVAGEPDPGVDTIVVALTEPVSAAHAPVPRTGAERMIFRELYDPLIRIDCTGGIHPALAERWAPDSSFRTWTFILRDARFADGSPVTAAAVVRSWRTRVIDQVWPWSGIASARATGERELAVTFVEPWSTLPRALADPALVATGESEGSWPAGTGAYRIDSAVAGDSGETLVLTPRTDTLPVLRIRVAPGVDARDLLDLGADRLVTRDPVALSYAAQRADLTATPLPWDRTYVLVIPPASGLRVFTDTTARRALAQDVVRAEARPAEPPYWWERIACHTAPRHGFRTSRRVVYPADDPTARELAERIVALAGPAAGDDPLVATPLASDAFEAALAAGLDVAYVAVVPARPPIACTETVAWPREARVVPLVDTRARLIRRR